MGVKLKEACSQKETPARNKNEVDRTELCRSCGIKIQVDFITRSKRSVLRF